MRRGLHAGGHPVYTVRLPQPAVNSLVIIMNSLQCLLPDLLVRYKTLRIRSFDLALPPIGLVRIGPNGFLRTYGEMDVTCVHFYNMNSECCASVAYDTKILGSRNMATCKAFLD